jgi:hypothetical protein
MSDIKPQRPLDHPKYKLESIFVGTIIKKDGTVIHIAPPPPLPEPSTTP